MAASQEITVTWGLYKEWVPQTVTVAEFLKEQQARWGQPDYNIFELLKHEDDRLVRPYFDYDQETPQDVMAARQKCIEALSEIFKADDNFSPEHNIKVGYRHGTLATGKFKTSWRFWVRGYCLPMKEMPALIKACSHPDYSDLWDMSVYSAKRKMGIPGACKSPQDPRVLELEDRDHPELCLIQALEGNEVQMSFPEDSHPPSVSNCSPPNWGTILPVLQAFGFHDPYPVGTRSKSITFRSSDIGRHCPCCSHTHDSQGYYAMQQEDGRLMVKNYSLRCRQQMLGESTCLIAAEDIIEEIRTVGHNRVDQLADTLRVRLNKIATSGVKLSSVVRTAQGFQFEAEDPTEPCGTCGKVHAAPYQCNTLILPCCQVVSCDPKCIPMIVGLQQSTVFWDLIKLPKNDTAFIKMFQMQQSLQGYCWVHEGESWYRFDGTLWRQSKAQDFTKELQRMATPVLQTLMEYVNEKRNPVILTQLREDGLDVKLLSKSLKAAHDYLQTKAHLMSIVGTAEITLLRDATFALKLDKNLDVCGAPNGVINLKTGELLKGAADQYVSKQVGVAYRGLEQSTPDVDGFFNSIFNEDQAVIQYVQRYLGYCLTGHVREQSFTMFWGAGSNGKSLLSDMLAKVFGEYYRNMSKDCLFQSDRRGTAGGTSSHLADLQGVRLAVVDESKESDVLDTALIKQQTGSSTINCRPLYKDNIVFEVTHKPLLLTNNKPRFNVDDSAMLRRLRVVPFSNVYKREADYDASNPTHRLMDPDLGDRMLSEPVLSQLLTWLVRGAVQWYQSRLGEKPQLLKDAEDTYVGENDVLGGFITSCCRTAADDMVDSTEFRQAFENATEQKISPAAMKARMNLRGFPLQRKRARGQGQKHMFIGLSLL